MEFSARIFLRNQYFFRIFLLSNILITSSGATGWPFCPTCSDFGTCSQKCIMIRGQAECSCLETFYLDSNNKTCTPNDPFRQLIFATKHVIYSIRRNTDELNDLQQQIPILNSTEEYFWDLTSDVRNNYLYGTNMAGSYKGIFRIHVNDTREPEILVDVGALEPSNIAFDWITGNLYFVDSSLGYIAVCTPNLTPCAKIVDEANKSNSSRLTALALHPNAGIMFWTDKGNDKAIRKGGMDGSNPTTIVSTSLLLPNGITVDESSSRIYWVDEGYEIIETTRFDGSERRKIFSSRSPWGIDVFDDMVYFTDWLDDEINIVNKFGGIKSTISTTEYPRGLTLMHISKQPMLRTNPCENMQCSHICSLSPTSAQCICPVGMIRNGNDCLDDEESPKLLLAKGNILLITRINAIGRDIFNQVQLTPQIKAIKALVYNPIYKSVIISDHISKNILDYKMESQVYIILVQTNLINVICLEMDPVAENLFWYDAGKLTLEVMSMRTKARAILMRDMPNIHDILFIPNHGAPYTSQLDNTGAQKDIGQIGFNKSNHVIEKSLYEFRDELNPVPLTYDMKVDDVHGVLLKNSRVFEQSITKQRPSFSYYFNSNFSIFDAVQINNQMFWVDTTDKVKVRTSLSVYDTFLQTIKINFDTRRMNNSASFRRKILAAVEPNSGPLVRLRSNHPCSPVNANRIACSHICLPTDTQNVGVCWCPNHLELGVDGTTCIGEEIETNEQDFTHGKNKMESQYTNKTDAVVVKNITSKFSSSSRSTYSISVNITVPIYLSAASIVVGLVIYMIMKLKRN